MHWCTYRPISNTKLQDRKVKVWGDLEIVSQLHNLSTRDQFIVQPQNVPLSTQYILVWKLSIGPPLLLTMETSKRKARHQGLCLPSDVTAHTNLKILENEMTLFPTILYLPLPSYHMLPTGLSPCVHSFNTGISHCHMGGERGIDRDTRKERHKRN